MELAPINSIANDFQAQSASNRSSYVIANTNSYLRAPTGLSSRHDFATLSRINSENHAVMARTTFTPQLNRSFKDVSDELNAIKYMSAFSGLDQFYVKQNYDSIVKRLYPQSSTAPSKITENFRSMLNNAALELDLNTWMFQKMNGNTSSYVQNQIDARLRNLKPTDEWINLMPQGPIRRNLEQAYYSIAKQYPQMKSNITSRIGGSVMGAAITAASLSLAYMTGGASLLAESGIGLAATTATKLFSMAAVKTGAHIGGSISSYDTMRIQTTGSNYRQVIERLELEGIDVDQKQIVQISKAIGAASAALELVGDEVLFGMFKVLSSQSMADQLVNMATTRAKQFLTANGKEVATELGQEALEYLATEAFLDAKGSDTTFDMELEEVLDLLWTITRDTTVNTIAYGGVGNVVGMAQDIKQISINQRNSPDLILSIEQRESLEAMPNFTEEQIQRGLNGNLTVSMDDADIDLTGEQIHQSIVTDPILEKYVSPAQEVILSRYIERNPQAVKLTEALSLLTGETDTTLRGLSSLSLVQDKLEELAQVRFTSRVLDGNADLKINGDVNKIQTETGEVAVRIRSEGQKLTVNLDQADGRTATLDYKIKRTGAIELQGHTITMNPDTLIEAVNKVLPKNVMYDNTSDLTNIEGMETVDRFLKKDLNNITLGDIKAFEEEANRATQIIADKRTPGETTTTRKVPQIKKTKEVYYENEEVIEEEVSDPEEEVSDPKVKEGDQIEEAVTQPESETEVDTNTESEEQKPSILRKFEAQILKAEQFIEEADAYNAKATNDMSLIGVNRYKISLAKIKKAHAIWSKALNDGESIENGKRNIEIARIDTISDDVDYLYNKYKVLPIYKDYSELNAKMRILKGYYTLLSDVSKDYFRSDYSTERLMELKWRKEYLLNQNEISNLGAESVSDTVSPAERASGLIDLSDFAAMEREARDINFTSKRNGIQKEIRDLKELRKKAKVREDKTYYWKKIKALEKQINTLPREVNGDIETTKPRVVIGIKPKGLEKPRVVIGLKTNVRRVRKTRTASTVEMIDKGFNEMVHDSDYSKYTEAKQKIDEAASSAQALKDTMEKMASLIRTLSANIATPEYKQKIKELALAYNYSLYSEAQIATHTEDVDGITEQSFDRVIEANKGQLTDLPMGKLKTIYNTVLAAARTDLKLTGYKVGNIEMGYQDVMKTILNEIGRNGQIRKGNKRKGRIMKALSSMYDSTLFYDLLIEKIHGKDTLIYKLLYQNVKDSSLKQRMFMHEFTKRYTDMFTKLPGVKDANKFYGEVLFSMDGIDITREMFLSLKQHYRSGVDNYNWRMIKESGLSFGGRMQTVRMSRESELHLMELVETRTLSNAEAQALDAFQSGMDELYDMANTRNLEVYGTPLERAAFYIRMRPDPSFELERGITPIDQSMRDNVSFAFAPANVKERMGSGKPILIGGLGQEFISTSDSISNFYYTYKDFSVAQNVINNPNVVTAMRNNFTDHYHDQISYGLERWSGAHTPSDAVDNIFDWTRRKFVTSVLTMNPEVAIKQTLSFPFFGVYVDAKYLGQAIFDTTINGAKIDKILMAWSTDYATRQEDAGNVDIMDTMNQRKGRHLVAGSKALEKVSWSLIRKADRVTVRAGMWGAMQQFLTEVEDQKFSPAVKDALDIDESIIVDLNETSKMQLAAKFAEYVLERTQPMQSPEHVSTFQRKTALGRSFSAFGSYTNQINNLMNRTYNAYKRGDPNAGKAFATTMFMAALMVPATTGLFDAARSMAWKGVKGEDPWEKDIFWQLFGKAYFGNVTGYWFVIRDFAKMMQQRIERGGGSSSGTEMVIFEQGDLLFTGAKQLFDSMWPGYSEERRRQAFENSMKNLARGTAYTTGLPYYPIKVATALYERSQN